MWKPFHPKADEKMVMLHRVLHILRFWSEIRNRYSRKLWDWLCWFGTQERERGHMWKTGPNRRREVRDYTT